MMWTPHVTVAAIAQQGERFLMVEEKAQGRLVINNPAGHLEQAESFIEAVQRETLEETGWEFEPNAVTGIYLWTNTSLQTTFLRIAFCGRCIRQYTDRPLDAGIVDIKWLTRSELANRDVSLRSPLVLRCIDDYLASRRYPLDLLTCLDPLTRNSTAAQA